MAKTKRKWRFNANRLYNGGNGSNTASESVPLSVSARIEQLRKEGDRALVTERLQQLSEVVNTKSAPRELREILQIPETVPIQPRLRRELRRFMNQGLQGPPGPRAPPSWSMSSSRSADGWKSGLNARAGRPGVVDEFSKLSLLHLGYHSLPKQGSLLDFSLKCMARNWDWVRVAGDEELSILPVAMRSCLLAYISRYSSPFSIVPATSLTVLFGTDATDLARIDLTGLLSADLTIRDLSKFISRSVAIDRPPDLSLLNISTPDMTTADTSSLAEDWEQEAASNRIFPSYNAVGPNSFLNLTHLSLASASKYASWKGLLDLAPKLLKLTHLSLAYWPVPSLTPNSSNRFIDSDRGRIPAGGTHLYSALHGDWQEAANILRRLSDSLYCLKWLDLQACHEWIAALVWEENVPYRRGPWNSNEGSSWSDEIKCTGPNWNESWSQIEHINLAQGDIPDDPDAIRILPSGLIQCQLLQHIRLQQHQSTEVSNLSDIAERDSWSLSSSGSNHSTKDNRWAGWAVLGWMENEAKCRLVASEIQARRKRYGGKWCAFDYGWEIPVLGTSIAN